MALDYSSVTAIDSSTSRILAPYRSFSGLMLSDGTLIKGLRASTLLYFYYSTDGGDTWTACATTETVDSGQGHEFTLAVDEFDIIYCMHVTSNQALSVWTFSGTDITNLLASTLTGRTARERSSLLAIDNPTATGNKTQLLFSGGSSTSMEINTLTFDRDTNTVGSTTNITTRTTQNELENNGRLLLESSVANSVVAATPSAPEASLIHMVGSNVELVYLNWDGVNHRWSWTGATHSVSIGAIATDQGVDAIYDPSTDVCLLVCPKSSTSLAYAYNTSGGVYNSTGWTTGTLTINVTIDGELKTMLTADGNGTARAWWIGGQLNQPNKALRYADFDTSTQTWGAEQTFESGWNGDSAVYTNTAWGWIGSTRYSIYTWRTSPSVATYGYTVAVTGFDNTSILTDPTLTSSNVLYVDELRGITYVIDTVLGVNDWSDPDWLNADWYYGDDDQIFVDSLTQTKVLQDTALVSINQLFVDGIDATRFLTDTQLESVNQFYAHTTQRQVNASPYWRWRFVRQNGHLFLIPAKSAQGWVGADVVSVDFRYNSDLMDYAMTSLVSAWATHSGSATATLKAAVDTALGDAGFKDMQGNAIT